jgi:stalled ribosome rescue protein Dom34
MSIYAVWLDHEHANLFKIHAGDIQHEKLVNKHHDHHTHNKNDRPRDSEHLFHELATKLSGAERIVIIGPGLAKDHFKTHLEKHHHQGIAKKIVATETVDKLTDNQILAWVREYFKHEFH